MRLSTNATGYIFQGIYLVMVKGMPMPAFAHPFAKIVGICNAYYAQDRSFGKMGNACYARDRCLDNGHARGHMWAVDVI